jgi:indole-3-pyruvate monooxygenase
LSTAERYPVVVIGAGPAGLATSAELRRRRIEHVVLERGATPGHSWMHLYDSLTLHTGKHLSALPRMSFDPRVPLFPTRGDFVAYLHRYVEVLELPIETDRPVTAVERSGDEWLVRTDQGNIAARHIVMATGIIAGPRVPTVPGRERFRGRVLHSVEYRRPKGFEGRRVLVVGVGNSGGEIGSELANAGARVTVAVRSGANVVPLRIAGIPIQYLAFAMRSLPRGARSAIAAAVGRITELRRGKPVLPRPAHGPLDSIPLIGFNLVDAIRAGKIAVRGGLAELTETGARFTDGREEPFDDVIFATGFTPALGPLGNLVRVDAKGFAMRTDRVTSADQPNLYFVGHTYDSTGGLHNIRRDAGLAAEHIAADASGRAA